jgi:uncharacterized ferritin-like protein (DUF455 family)
MEFFSTLEKILQIKNLNQKLTSAKQFIIDYNQNKFEFNHNYSSLIPPIASYEEFCKIVPAQQVPRRGFGTKLKKAILIHAIVHIEYSAIDLAFDASYRFRNMPKKFYDDWIEVADDEIRHFEMMNTLLNELGFKYGDFPVHNSLIQAAQKTPTLIERMAIVPRWLEANGLDKNEQIIQKLQNYKNDEMAQKMIKNLKIILKEEIPHVQKGDFWFKWACKQENKDISKTYFEIVNKMYKNIEKNFLNIQARKEAGFSCDELQLLSKQKIEC